MSFAERAAANPGAFASGCLIWIPVSIWVISMIHWMVQGDIDAGFGFLGLCAGIALGALTVFSPNPALSPLLLAAAVSIVVLFPFVRSLVNRHALAQLDVEQVERSYEMLEQKPSNSAASLRLARVLYSRGIRGHAIRIAESAFQGMPSSFFQDEARMLQQWKLQTTEPNEFRDLPCARCGELNSAGTLFCTRCKAPFLLDYARGRWVEGSAAQKLIATWFLAVVLLVAIPFTASLLTPTVGVVLICIEVALGVFVLVRAFGLVFGSAAR